MSYVASLRLVVAVLALAGCGGGGGSSASDDAARAGSKAARAGVVDLKHAPAGRVGSLREVFGSNPTKAADAALIRHVRKLINKGRNVDRRQLACMALDLARGTDPIDVAAGAIAPTRQQVKAALDDVAHALGNGDFVTVYLIAVCSAPRPSIAG